MAITPTKLTPYRRFQDPLGIVFIPWTSASALGETGYDIHDIVGDTVSVTQDDPDTTEIPHEFSDDPLDENTKLGKKNLTMQCLDFQNNIMKALFGWDVDTVSGYQFAPSAYKDLHCCVILRFEGKSVIMPRVKMNTKTVFENLRTDIARGELAGTLYMADVTVNTSTIETPMLFAEHSSANATVTIGGQTITMHKADTTHEDGEVEIGGGSTPAATTYTVTIPSSALSGGELTVSDGTTTKSTNDTTIENLSGVANNTAVTLTAIPDDDYTFTKFVIGGQDYDTSAQGVTAGTNGVYTYELTVTADVTVSATFTQS